MIAVCRCACHVGDGKRTGCCPCPFNAVDGKPFLNFKTITCYCVCHFPNLLNGPAPCVCTCNTWTENELNLLKQLDKPKADLEWQKSVRDFSKLGNKPIIYNSVEERLKNLETRLKELEDWTRKDEDRIYDRLAKLNQGAAILKADFEYYEKAAKAMESRVKELEGKLAIVLNALSMIK